MPKIEVQLRRRADNKQGLKKLHGPTIRSDLPATLEFPRREHLTALGLDRPEQATFGDALISLGHYLKARPTLEQRVQRQQADRVR